MKTLFITTAFLLSISFGQAQSEYIVQLTESTQTTAVRSLLGQNAKCISSHANIYLVESKDISHLQSDDRIIHIQPNRKLITRGNTPNDPERMNQYALDLIGVQQLWDRQTGGISRCSDTIVLAIFDDDFDVRHNDLVPNIWTNKNEIPNNGMDDDNNGYIDDYYGLNLDVGTDQHVIDAEYHGTSVAGVIGAVGNNGAGMTGMNWNVKLLFLSSLDKTEALAIEAFNYLIDLRKAYNESQGTAGAYVVAINNSWGLEGVKEEEAPLLCDMFNKMGAVGILSVGATENDQSNTDFFGDIPSDCSSDHLIVVTNTDENDELSVAGFGKENVDLSAPGEGILSLAANNSTFGGYSGTSYAAPIVTGAIGLLYAIDGSLCDLSQTDPSAAALACKSIIMQSTTPVPSLADRTVTGGRLDLTKALDLLSNNHNQELSDIEVYPNPASNYLYLRGLENASSIDIRITNILGQVLVQQRNNNRLIYTGDLTAGQYALRINVGDSEKTMAFVKR